MRGEIASHSTVNHKRKEYVRREDGNTVTTNTVEGYVSLAKRAIYGSTSTVILPSSIFDIMRGRSQMLREPVSP